MAPEQYNFEDFLSSEDSEPDTENVGVPPKLQPQHSSPGCGSDHGDNYKFLAPRLRTSELCHSLEMTDADVRSEMTKVEDRKTMKSKRRSVKSSLNRKASLARSLPEKSYGLSWNESLREVPPCDFYKVSVIPKSELSQKDSFEVDPPCDFYKGSVIPRSKLSQKDMSSAPSFKMFSSGRIRNQFWNRRSVENAFDKIRELFKPRPKWKKESSTVSHNHPAWEIKPMSSLHGSDSNHKNVSHFFTGNKTRYFTEAINDGQENDPSYRSINASPLSALEATFEDCVRHKEVYFSDLTSVTVELRQRDTFVGRKKGWFREKATRSWKRETEQDVYR